MKNASYKSMEELKIEVSVYSFQAFCTKQTGRRNENESRYSSQKLIETEKLIIGNGINQNRENILPETIATENRV